MSPDELRATIEAILFVSGEPVSLDRLTEALPGEGREAIAAELETIRTHFDDHVGGFGLEEAGGGYRFASRPSHDSIIRKFFARQGEGRLSLAALETLAIIAYRQPMTAPEISDIRGVNSSGVLRTLLDRRMIRIAGRKAVVGSPFLYRTTREFLMHFGLNSVQDLPRLEEFADLLGENIGEEMLGEGTAESALGAEPQAGAETLEGEETDRQGGSDEDGSAKDEGDSSDEQFESPSVSTFAETADSMEGDDGFSFENGSEVYAENSDRDDPEKSLAASGELVEDDASESLASEISRDREHATPIAADEDALSELSTAGGTDEEDDDGSGASTTRKEDEEVEPIVDVRGREDDEDSGDDADTAGEEEPGGDLAPPDDVERADDTLHEEDEAGGRERQ